MRVLVTGATGFIGRALVKRLLERGDSVSGLTRNTDPARLPEALREVRWVGWDPGQDGAWQAELGEHDAIVHLAGETAVGRRYTPQQKEKILDSRVGSTTRIVRGLERVERRPKVLVCASGMDFYGARDDATPLDESAPRGNSFLAEVCAAWEAAAREAEQLGVRVVLARIGFVLGRGGGALAKLVPIFKAFAGGPIGNGKQMVSWVHLDDVVGALSTALDDATLQGPMNVTGPNPVSNADFSRALGRALGRPAVLPAPAFALRMLYGEGADPILSGRAVLPRVLMDHGYRHRFTSLDAALTDLLR